MTTQGMLRTGAAVSGAEWSAPVVQPLHPAQPWTAGGGQESCLGPEHRAQPADAPPAMNGQRQDNAA